MKVGSVPSAAASAPPWNECALGRLCLQIFSAGRTAVGLEPTCLRTSSTTPTQRLLCIGPNSNQTIQIQTRASETNSGLSWLQMVWWCDLQGCSVVRGSLGDEEFRLKRSPHVGCHCWATCTSARPGATAPRTPRETGGLRPPDLPGPHCKLGGRTTRPFEANSAGNWFQRLSLSFLESTRKMLQPSRLKPQVIHGFVLHAVTGPSRPPS